MKKKLRTRFLPLYIAAFFQGLVFWYSIEKLFMTKTLGFSSQGVAGATMLVVVAVLVFEMPSGVLADRWSRKGVLMLSTFSLLLSTIVGGLSKSRLMYIGAILLWGIFFALYSGIYEAVVYDTLIEEGGHERHYELFLGRVVLLNSVGLVVGSLCSGLIANWFGIRAPYFFTIPATIICMIVLQTFKEPSLHKASHEQDLFRHLKDMFHAIIKDPSVMALLLPIAGAILLVRMVFEFNQLFYIALAVPVVLFGPLGALVQSSIGFSGLVAGKSRGRVAYYVLLATMVAGALLLVFRVSPLVTVIGHAAVLTSTFALSTILQGKLHGMLSSKMRAGASSAANTFGQILFLPVAFIFGYVTQHHSVFVASWLAVGIAALIALGSLKHVDRAVVKA